MKAKEMGGKETGGKEMGAKEMGVKMMGVKEMGGEEMGGKAMGAKAPGAQYSSEAVIEGLRRRAMVFVVDSIVRKTDRVLSKGDNMVVCFPGAKIEVITERVEKL